MGYFIRQIPDNKYNNYKYSYLDHLQLVIDVKFNYWYFFIELFYIHNSSLPLNTFTMDMQLPYQQVNNIIFNLAVSQGDVREKVKANGMYAKLYESKFCVDMSQNQYLKQKLTNDRLSIKLNLEIDPQVIAKAGFNPNQDDLDGLINETGQQKFEFSLFYSNTYLVNKSNDFQNTYRYRLSAYEYICTSDSSLMKISCNDYSCNQQALNNLVKICSTEKFEILYGKVTFNYWLGKCCELKTFEEDIDIPINHVDKIEICLNKYTNYDFINNKVVLDSDGIKGFYIPILSHGYYQLVLKIKQNDCINTFIINNNFNFCFNNTKPSISCNQILIDNLKGFKEIKF